MADNERIKVDELDFNTIKTNLKTFLKGQTKFKGYNFDGSALGTLIDLLAYNTHYNGIYNNLAVNEMFLDSASKRSSVVSLAKMLGYTPRSATASTAVVNMTVTNYQSPDNTLVLPRFTPFNALVEGDSFTFYTISESITPISTDGKYRVNNITLKQGRPVTQTFIVEPGARYVLSNSNIDTSTIKVLVTPNVSTVNSTAYTQATDITVLTANSEVYFIKEMEDNLYEVYFGNGVLGKKPAAGNVVTVQYLVTDGSAANGSKGFKYSGPVFGAGTVSVATVKTGYGGGEPETIEEIKFNAPKHHVMQNRAVTETDYTNIIFKNFPNTETVNVWGGEENDPPYYNKVFLSIKPKGALFLTPEEKTFIKNQIIRPKSILTVTPEIVDPEYLQVVVTTTVYYNPNATTSSVETIRSRVLQTIKDYNTVNLSKFDSVLRYSKLVSKIDASDKGITNNITTVILRREVTPKFDMNAEYRVNIGNPIYYSEVPEEAITTTGFFIAGFEEEYYIKDDGIGNLILYYNSVSGEVVVNPKIGYYDWKTGLIVIPELNISSLVGNTLEFIVKPQSNDVASVRNQIVTIAENLINVTVTTSRIGSNYVFTSSRT